MKPIKRYFIGHYREDGKDFYPIYYKRDHQPWHWLATAEDKAVAEQTVARLKANDEKQETQHDNH